MGRKPPISRAFRAVPTLLRPGTGALRRLSLAYHMPAVIALSFLKNRQYKSVSFHISLSQNEIYVAILPHERHN
jgi:hypothetical protein